MNSTPAVRDGVVYAGTSDTHRFFALDAKTGRLLWNADAQALIFGSPAVAGDQVYIGAFNGRLLVIDARSGKVAWSFATDGSKDDPLKLLDAAGGFDRSRMGRTFYNFLDMTVNLWRMFTVGAILSSPVIDRGVLYVGSADGCIYALR